MTHPHPLKAASNLFAHLNGIGQGVAGLGTALQAVDLERIEDPATFVSSIGLLVETLGGAILETAFDGRRDADRALGESAG